MSSSGSAAFRGAPTDYHAEDGVVLSDCGKLSGGDVGHAPYVWEVTHDNKKRPTRPRLEPDARTCAAGPQGRRIVCKDPSGGGPGRDRTPPAKNPGTRPTPLGQACARSAPVAYRAQEQTVSRIPPNFRETSPRTVVWRHVRKARLVCASRDRRPAAKISGDFEKANCDEANCGPWPKIAPWPSDRRCGFPPALLLSIVKALAACRGQKSKRARSRR